MIIEAAAGCVFSDRLQATIKNNAPKDRGAHGYLPSHPGMEATFIAAGREIEPGLQSLGKISLKQIAPTIAQLANLPADILASDEVPLSRNSAVKQ